MDTRITHSSYVINFLDVNFDSKKLSKTLKLEADRILRQITFENLQDWEIEFRGAYGKGEKIRVYKKTRSYTTDKIKLIVIHIPIPINTIVPWGVEESQQVDLTIPKNSERYFDVLPVDYNSFSNINDYLLDSFRRGIEHSFKDGFKVNGNLVIFKPN
ncbi:Imm9 family immunity protein [Rufibacter tibetensis]|uniref:Uncharacterized protein n=1 Tax=Rufibacter tibetensis TaxID=512763 RepID=A0A0P0CAH4_9BACT|nr:Imm9 family immunity protein [Rufibacter tibetensis]ALI98517.1 hypothetical protein DC20_05435 [Rufibacter tibetensis]